MAIKQQVIRMCIGSHEHVTDAVRACSPRTTVVEALMFSCQMRFNEPISSLASRAFVDEVRLLTVYRLLCLPACCLVSIYQLALLCWATYIRLSCQHGSGVKWLAPNCLQLRHVWQASPAVVVLRMALTALDCGFVRAGHGLGGAASQQGLPGELALVVLNLVESCLSLMSGWLLHIVAVGAQLASDIIYLPCMWQ